MKFITRLFIFIIFTQILNAEGDTLFKNELIGIHPKAGINFNFYNLNLSRFFGAVDCGVFSEGSGSSYFGELQLERAIDETFQITLSTAYIDRSGSFSVENQFKSRDLNTNEVITVTTQNKINTDITFFEIIPELKYVIFPKLINGPFRVGFGPRFSIPMIKKFDQKEHIISPSSAVFINSSGIRNQTRDMADGDILTMNSLQYGLRIALDNLLKIGGDNYFTQTLSFDYNLSNVTSDTEWKIYSLNLALGIRFSVKNPEAQPDPEIKYEMMEEEKKEPEIVIIEKPSPVFNFSLVDVKDLKIETGKELLATIPLVNAVFFDLNNSSISSFYKLERNGEIELFYSDPIKMHTMVLIRIADILKKNPKAKITLQSSTSGNDEIAGVQLSKERCDNVKNALVNLGVPNEKITQVVLLNPKNPSNPEVAEGRAENRRVEIIVSDAPLQEYVDILNYRELNGKAIYSLKLENMENSKVTISNSVTEQLVQNDKSVEDSIYLYQRLTNEQNSINLTLTAKSNDSELTDKKSINFDNVEEINQELKLNNFLAILLFEFNSSELSNANKSLLSQLSEKLPANSTIELIGTTDIIGTNDYNQELALQRATNTEKFINNITKNKFKIVTKTKIEKFDDSSPQGRYLNRSIKIRLLK